jgi:predicted PurR-regulated permease PerM
MTVITRPDADRQRITVLFYYGAVIVLGYFLFRIFSPFFTPLGWATVLAIFVYPWYERLCARQGETRAALITTILVAMLIIGPGLAVLTAFVREGRDALSGVDRAVLADQFTRMEELWNRLVALVPGDWSVDLPGLLEDTGSRAATVLAARAGGLLADVAILIVQLFVTLLALFFLLRDAKAIMSRVRLALPFDEQRTERMIAQTRDMVFASVATGLAIASLQGFAGGLLFAMLGLGAPVFWGVVMAFLALLPFVGTYFVWLPAGIWLLATGEILRGVVLLTLGATVVASIDNVVRPAVLSGRARMNGLVMFISLLGGVLVFGLLGLVLGPLIVAIATGLLDAYTTPRHVVGPETTGSPAAARP